MAAYLRLWGLESGYGHNNNFQPDEFISLRGVLQIDLESGKLKVPGAYFEGTFNYYLWALPLVARDVTTTTKYAPGQQPSAEKFRFLLYSGRLMSVAFDLATILVIFFIIGNVTGAFMPAIVGSFLYSIAPMQVIYSHFMRTHLLSNLLCSLVILLSLKARRHRRWWLFLFIGILCGLGMATRYPVGVIAVIPCLILMFQKVNEPMPLKRRMWRAVVNLMAGPAWWLAAGFVVGLFLGEPMLFLDPRRVLYAISHETLHYVPAGATKLFNLTPLWKYVAALIPYAMYPLLWLPAYASILYLCFQRKLYHVTLPLLLFALIYTYPMAKGYLVVFARQVMLLLPVFCILIGIALNELARHRLVRNVGVLLLILTALPSIAFDWAYVRAMQRTDSRVTLQKELRNMIGKGPVSIGVSQSGGYFYTAMPAVEPLKSQNVAVALQGASVPADFFVAGFERPFQEDQLAVAVRNIEKEGSLKLVRAYSSVPTIFGKQIDLSNCPLDMTYPFPGLLLFRSSSRL
jgi:dolichyl-phosphate-mannose-protein mannosyltransferase